MNFQEILLANPRYTVDPPTFWSERSRGFKDRVVALGPEFSIFIPNPGLTFQARYEPEFAACNRTEGQTIVFSLVWVAKSLVKLPPH